ncbi:efflux RND transporter periplasmic adaptor subunit [Singulisphaera sp. Ch08]|uniref:Efflux RND transporter periplasmic adaptor subunit n=1 Tax=Singulisphaera sp. Ch08 TaxID=3120278 RepID=A0AAU7C783_9BACT
MLLPKKAAALAAGFVTVLSIASVAQVPAPRSSDTLPVSDATIDWIEKSDVAALREGVIEKMELQIGMLAQKDKPIGYLHKEIAKLTVKKAQVAVDGKAAEAKAEAQKQLAIAIVATSKRLNARKPDMVSLEEMRKAEAEVQVAAEMKNEAIERRSLDTADLALAQQALDEHTILAPFDGIIIERIKNPGESVRANEAVVRLGNLDKLRAWAYIPLEYASRVKEGQIVLLQQKLGGAPSEKKVYRGKITFVDPQIQPIAEVAVRIYAEFENPEHELRPGAKAVMNIQLGTEAAAANPTVGSRPTVGLER